MEIALGLAVVVFVAAASYALWRRRRRAALMGRLESLLRELGWIMGSQEEEGTSSFEGFEGSAIVLLVDGKRLEIDLIAALEIQGEPDPERRRQRLRWLVDQARIRQGV